MAVLPRRLADHRGASRAEEGINVVDARPGDEEEPPPVDEIREAVEAWRSQLNEELAEQLPEPLDWDESEAAPYFTDKPDWEGYGSVLLLAVYDERGDLRRPTRVVGDWTRDRAWKEGSKSGFEASRYQHLLLPEMWLPGGNDLQIVAEDPAGDEVEIGSTFALLEELQELNARTFRGDPRSLEEWRQAGPSRGESFDEMARFGLAVLLELAGKAVEHRLPMKLDY